MKTIKTTARMIALTFVMGLALNLSASAGSEASLNNPYYSDLIPTSFLELDKEFDLMEANLREEGVLECDNAELIIVLGENDEIVYQGSYQLEDENNAFMTRLLTKADFIMSSGNKSFYKVF